MSVRRLVNIIDTNATAYPPPPPPPIPRSNQPISTRRVTDETYSESNAAVVSEDEDSDNDSEHLLDYNTRILSRRQAEARVRNKLRQVQNLVNGFAQHGDHLYNDVARPFFDETIFMAHVVVLTIGRLLLRLFWFILEGLWRTILLALDLIIEAIWIICNMVWASFEFVLDLLLRVVFAIPQILRSAPWWMVKYIPGSIVSMLVILSLMRGFKGITNFICADPGLTKEWTSLAGACNHTHIKDIIKHENMELDELVHANDVIFQSVVKMSGIGRPDPHPGHVLMRETLALVQFTETHNDSLTAFSKRHDLVAVANAVHSNVTAFNKDVERFAHNHHIRLNELEIRMQKILKNAKEHRAQSPYARFLLESATFVFPNTFSHTGVGHQTSHYAGVTTHFLNSPQTTTILQQANNITLHMSRAAQDLVIVREAITRYEPFWRKNCQPNGKVEISDAVDCGVVDPADLNQRLQEALQQTQAAAGKPKELRKLHNKVKNAMTHLRGNLVRLLKIAAEEISTAAIDDEKIAAKYKTAAAGKTVAAAGKKMDVKDRLAIIAGMKTSAGVNRSTLDPTSTRAVLHQFVVEVGAIDLMIGSGTFEAGMGLGEGVAMGSRYERRSDGSLVPHLWKYS
ncbi:hypothetical protein MBLNU13_g05464t1 [Cladosporium sp. NU13]